MFQKGFVLADAFVAFALAFFLFTCGMAFLATPLDILRPSESVILSFSKPPAPTGPINGGQPEQAQTVEHDQTTSNEERGSDQRPFAVKIVSGPTSKSEADANTEERKNKATYDRLTGWGTFTTALLTGVLAIIAVGQVFLFYWQLKLIRAGLADTKEAADAARSAAKTAAVSVNLARKTAKTQLRAYIGIVGGEMAYLPLTEGGHGLDIQITLKNFGQTPGYKMTTWIKPPKIRNKDSIPFDDPTPIHERESESMVAPGGIFIISWVIPIRDADLTMVNSGSKRIFVWGGLDFEDAFGQPRHFIFRMTNGKGQISIVGQRFALQPHKMGYDAN